jgi:hypothetical protein
MIAPRTGAREKGSMVDADRDLRCQFRLVRCCKTTQAAWRFLGSIGEAALMFGQVPLHPPSFEVIFDRLH